MRGVFLVALWAAISVPVALGVAAIVRATRGVGVADEVELYLKGPDRSRRRPVTLAVLSVSIAAIGFVLAPPVPGVTERVHTVATSTRELFGLAPDADAPAESVRDDPAGSTAPPARAVAPRPPLASEREVQSAPTGGVIEAGGILGGPSDESYWRRDEDAADADADAPANEPGTAPADGADVDDDATTAENDGGHDEADNAEPSDAAAPDGEETVPAGDAAPAEDGSADGDAPARDDEQPPAPAEPRDLDGDGTPNDEDTDLDGDGIPNDEDTDLDGDGIPNDEDTDRDGDGIPNDEEGTADTQEAKRDEPAR